MATNDVVSLVATLKADGSNFAAELSKATKAVSDLATEAAASTKEMAAAIGTDAATAGQKVAAEFTEGAEKVSAEIDELKTEIAADMKAVTTSMTGAATQTEKTWRDANGRLRSESGKFVKSTADSVKAASGEVKKSTNEIAESVGGIAQKAAVAFTAFGTAVLAGLAMAAKGTMEFKNEMAGVFALVNSETRTPEMVSALTEGARQIRAEFGMTGQEVAEAMRVAIGSGIEAADATEFLAKSAKAAVSGMVPLKDVVQVTASTVKAYGLTAADAQRVQDALAKAVNLGTVEWTHLANGLGQVVPFAKQSGMSIEELAGTIAELTLKGFPADQAMTSLKAALVGVQEPMPEAQAMFDRLGISLRDSEGKARPFLTILAEVKAKLAEKGVVNVVDDKEIAKTTKKLKKLQEKVAELNSEMSGAKSKKEKLGITKKLDDANKEIAKTKQHLEGVMNTVQERLDKDGTVAELFGDVNAKAVGVALMSDNLESLDATLGEMKNSAGAVNEQFEAFTEDNPRFEMEKLGQQFALMREQIGEAVIAAFKPLMASIAETVTRITEWVKANPELTATIVKIAAVVGALAVGIGGIATVIAGVAGIIAVFSSAAMAAALPVIGIIAIVIGVITVIAGLAMLIYQNWDGIADFFVQCWEVIKNAFSTAWEFIKGVVTGIVDGVLAVVNGIWEGIKSIFTIAFNIIAGIVMAQIEIYKALFNFLFAPLIEVVVAFWDSIKGYFTAAFDWLAEKVTAGWEVVRNIFMSVVDYLAEIVVAIWTKISEAFMAGFEYVANLVSQGWAKVVEVWNAALDTIMQLLSKLWAPFGSFFDKVIQGWQNIFDKASEIFNNIWENLKAGWEAAKAGPQQFSDWLVQSIQNAVTKAMELLAQLWEKAKDLPGAIWEGMKNAVGVGDGAGTDVPAMATGGIVRKPTIALIGEAGPEAVIPLNGGAIPIDFGGYQSQNSAAGSPVGGGDTYQIYQQPGESTESLAKRIAEYKMRKRGFV